MSRSIYDTPDFANLPQMRTTAERPTDYEYEQAKRERRPRGPIDNDGMELVYRAPPLTAPDEVEISPNLSYSGVTIPQFDLGGDEAERAAALLEILLANVPNARELLSKVVTRNWHPQHGGHITPTAVRIPAWSTLFRFLALTGAEALATRISKANSGQLDSLASQLAASASEPGPSTAWKAEQAKKRVEEARALAEARAKQEAEQAEQALREEAERQVQEELRREEDDLVTARLEELRALKKVDPVRAAELATKDLFGA